MNPIIKFLILVLFIVVSVSCSYHSYQPAYTEINVPEYNKPDSLASVSDSFSVASIIWQDYYADSCLHALIDTALTYNYTLQAAFVQLQKAEAYYLKCNRSFWPGVDFKVNNNHLRIHEVDHSFSSYGLGLGIYNWEIDLWGRLRSTKRAGMAALLREDANVQGMRVKLIAEVATLYYNLIGLDYKLNAVNDVIKTNEAYLNEQELLIPHVSASSEELDENEFDENAHITRAHVSVEQAKAELYRAQAVKPDVMRELFIKENALNLLLGRPYGVIPRSQMEDILDRRSLSDTVHIGVPADLLQYRPDVIQAEYAVREAYHLEDAAKSSFYPALTLSGNLAIEGNEFVKWFEFPGTLLYNLFTGLTQPIFRKGELRYNKRMTELDRKQKLINYKQCVLEACVEVSNTLKFYEMNRTKALNQLNRYKALMNAFTYSRYLYKDNKALYLDVLASQSQLLQVRMELSDSFTSFFTNRIALYKALGGGSRLY